MTLNRSFIVRSSIALLALLALVALAWLLRPAQAAPIQASLSVVEAINADDVGFDRATEQREFTFPADHGPHPEYQTEWW